MDIAGTYQVEVVEKYAASGEVQYPFGAQVSGMLLYGSDGAMAAVVGRADQPALDMDLLAGTVAATESDQAEAFRAAYGFAGTYRIAGDIVHHRILVSTVPNWVGTEQLRPFELEAGVLTLRPPGWRVIARRLPPGGQS